MVLRRVIAFVVSLAAGVLVFAVCTPLVGALDEVLRHTRSDGWLRRLAEFASLCGLMLSLVAAVLIARGIYASVAAALPPPVGHCQKCGYNLTGNTSGICPECGTPLEK